MNLSAYSLKTGILATLVIVLLLAMLLLDIVMLNMTERDMLRTEQKMGRLLLCTIGQTIVTGHKGGVLGVTDSASPVYRGLRSALDAANLSGMLIVNESGKTVFQTEIAQANIRALATLAAKSLETGQDMSDLSAWGALPFLPFKKGNLFLASPILHEKRVLGATSVQIPLGGMYSTIRKSQKIVFFYILLNTLFLALFGFYLLYRSIIRPINRLVSRAEEFKEGEAFLLSSDTQHNEFGKLSRAVNMTLRGLEDSKAELRESVNSLKKTNRELRQAQEEIIRSEKLASIGRLASGVAHEIGNPIGIVLGYLDLLRGNDLTKEERGDFIGRIESEIDRINRTIQDLLNFSRPSKGEVKAVSVQKIIADMLEMLKPQPMMADINVEIEHQTAQDTVLADPDKLKQVFLNIIMNAIDALETQETQDKSAHKTLAIRTNVVAAPELGREERGAKVHIQFTDNGTGIPGEELNSIFDPFFTTKEPGKGTGLGLSVSLRIIEDMGGDIKAHSEPGSGTSMTVMIPLHES